MPHYKHRCEECLYAGEDRQRGPKEGRGYTDVYYHPGWRKEIAFFVRRWGNGKWDMEQKTLAQLHRLSEEPDREERTRWSETYRLIQMKGFLK